MHEIFEQYFDIKNRLKANYSNYKLESPQKKKKKKTKTNNVSDYMCEGRESYLQGTGFRPWDRCSSSSTIRKQTKGNYYGLEEPRVVPQILKDIFRFAIWTFFIPKYFVVEVSA